MSTQISYDNAELAYVETRTSKKGNAYAKGILILRDASGKFEASLRFRSFDAVDAFHSLELQYFAKESAQPDTSAGDLAFVDGEPENTETRERNVAKATLRPTISVSGKLRSSQLPDKTWETVFMVDAVGI